MIASFRFVPPDGCCETFKASYVGNVKQVAAFDMSTLGLVPPFHVEGP